ncbi:hypothetical protein ABPG74_009779 [Tetrahymena malaccensis]
MDQKNQINNDFDYLLILDFEATCEKNVKLECQEIIEFPVVVLDVKNQQILDVFFHHYLKPSVNPQLTAFCTELTGIKQDQVDKGISLQEALAQLTQFLEQNKLIGSSFTFVTCGDFDLGNCLRREALYKKIEIPQYLKNYINIKKVFPKQYYPKKQKEGDNRLPDMVGMLQGLNLKLDGHHHSGIDDSRNIAKVALTLLQKGFKFNKNMRAFVNY